MSQDVHSPQDVDLYSPLDPAALPDDPAVLKQILLQLVAMLRKETKRREDVERNMDLLLRKLTAPKSLPACAGQQTLFDVQGPLDEPPPAPTNPEVEQPAAPAPRRHAHGRRKPPANLEQVDIIHDLPDEVKQELGPENLRPLPDVVTFQYDYHAPKLCVLRHVQKKYLHLEPKPNEVAETPTTDSPLLESADVPLVTDNPAGDQAQAVAQPAVDHNQATDQRLIGQPLADLERAPGPSTESCPAARSRPIIVLASKRWALPSCEAAPGLLAFIWLSKYGDHLPLYRLETICERYGIHFPRSTTCGWMLELAEVLQPLWRRMAREVLLSRVIHTDDTTVPLQDPETGQRSTARFWNYLGDEQHALTVLEFTRTHEREGPATFLAGYRGYLQADAYNGYDGLYLPSGGGMIEVGCWQHARKRYKEATKSDVRATCAMAFIKSMYAVEDQIRKLRQTQWASLPLDEQAARIVEIRQRETVPILKSFRAWIDKTVGDTLPKSDLGEAFRYTLNQWGALNQFPHCGLLSIDNNAAERGHRGIAIGRNNWKFVGSERGGQAAAIHFSLIASCKRNAVEPFAYLVDVLKRLPSTPAAELAELMPNRWKPRPTT